jgi:predicted NUDIX family phosphoesterase
MNLDINRYSRITISCSDPEVKEHHQKDLVDEIWESEIKKEDKILYNSEILVLKDIFISDNEIIIEGEFIDYKLYFASRNSPAIKQKIEPICVSGVIVIKEKDREMLLIAERSERSATYPGYLEFVPSGGIDKMSITNSNNIDYKIAILQELKEEVGVLEKDIENIETLGLIYDREGKIYDICCKIYTELDREKFINGIETRNEYDKPLIIEKDKTGEFLKSHQKIVPTSKGILTLL